MPAHILLIEDARPIQLLVRAALEDKHTITFAETIAEGERFMEAAIFDLILLDVVLPDGSGFDLCERFKAGPHKDVPILFLSAQVDVKDRVRGLNLGAEDYILKPFEAEELQARVSSHLRRSRSAQKNRSAFRAGNFLVDTTTQKVVLHAKNAEPREMDLTRIEFKLLVHFLRNPSKIFSRRDLLKHVWGEDTHVSEHTVDTHISSLRKKMAGSDCELKSVVKRGYCVELSRT